MIADLLTDRCTIQARTVTRGMTDVEAWSSQADPTPCRLLKRSAVKGNAEKTQYSTVISARFALPLSAVISIRDRILHEGRVYDVVEVIEPFAGTAKHHKVAVCDAFAGDVALLKS